MTEGVYPNDEERRRAERYSRIREWLALAGIAWSLTEMGLALATGLSGRLRSLAQRVAPPRLGPVLPYMVLSTLLSTLSSLPLSYYSGWVVEHRYGLSNQSRLAWLGDELKGLAVGIAIGAPLMQGAYWLLGRFRQSWWLILSALTVPLSILFANLAPVLLMPLFNRFEPLRDRALARRIMDLAEQQGVHVSDVLQMDMSRQTKKANAFFTGVGNTKRIVLGDTLLDEFTPDEVEVVLAHELGHQVHRDIWKMIALSAPTTVLGLYAAHRLAPVLIRRFGQRWGLDLSQGLADVAALPLLTLVAGLALQLVTPLLNALSRRTVEHPADRYALELTHNPDAFISAMQKLGRMNLANPHPHPVVKWLMYSHPTLRERIEFARRYGASEEHA